MRKSDFAGLRVDKMRRLDPDFLTLLNPAGP